MRSGSVILFFDPSEVNKECISFRKAHFHTLHDHFRLGEAGVKKSGIFFASSMIA